MCIFFRKFFSLECCLLDAGTVVGNETRKMMTNHDDKAKKKNEEDEGKEKNMWKKKRPRKINRSSIVFPKLLRAINMFLSNANVTLNRWNFFSWVHFCWTLFCLSLVCFSLISTIVRTGKKTVSHSRKDSTELLCAVYCLGGKPSSSKSWLSRRY